jgi:hypothetical protein
MLNFDPHGVAAVALFLGVTTLITYLTRNNADAQAIVDALADVDI